MGLRSSHLLYEITLDSCIEFSDAIMDNINVTEKKISEDKIQEASFTLKKHFITMLWQ